MSILSGTCFPSAFNLSRYGLMITYIGEKELVTWWEHKDATLTALANRMYLVQQRSVVRYKLGFDGKIAKPKQLKETRLALI